MRARISSPRFVGRSAELELLTRAFKSSAADERASTVLLGGEAGVGKTRLTAELAAVVEAADGLVLSGSCLDLSNAPLPFGPIVQALRALHRSLDADTLATVIGTAGEVLDRLLPEVRSTSSDRDAGVGELFEHLLGVFERLGDHTPTLLVLEDLHWADHSTRDLVAYLAHNLADARVMVLCTYRSDDLHRRHPLRPVLAELDRSGAAEHVMLERFNREELREMIAAILGDDPDGRLIDAVFERSEGNPFFAEELIASGSADELPASVREIVLARIDGLSQPTQTLLGVVSVIGRRADHRLVAAVYDTSTQSSTAALREATDQQVLTIDQADGAYRFRHALVCEAVYDDLLPGERVQLHARLGDLLTQHPEWCQGGPGALAGELAVHWTAAHDTRRALPATIDAAREAERMFAHPEALDHVERALELWPQVADAAELCGLRHVDVQMWAGRLAELSGSLDRALDFAATAAAEATDDIDPVTAGLLRERWSMYLHLTGGPFDQVIDHIDTAIRLIPESAAQERALALARRGAYLMLSGRGAAAVSSCEESIALAQQVGAQAIESHARNSLGVSLSALGDTDGALTQLRTSRRLAIEARSWDDVTRAYTNECSVLAAAGRHEEAAACAVEGIEVAQEHGRGHRIDVCLRPAYGEQLWALGRWREICPQLDMTDTTPVSGIDEWCITRGRTEALAGLGHIDEARALLERYRAMLGGTVESSWLTELANLETQVAWWSGDLDAAVESARRGMAITFSTAVATDVNSAIGLPLNAMAVATRTAAAGAAGDAPPDLTVVRQFAEQFTHWTETGRWGLAPVTELALTGRQVAAELTTAEGHGDPEDWAGLADAWSSVGRSPWAAYARLRQAELMLGAGDRAGAADAASIAHRLADSIGWRWLLDTVADLARRARLDIGANDTPTKADNPFGLTERELGVLSLVAAGRTNRQIAETLFISTKTASAHVSSLLSKLGVTNRGEAGAAARRLGLD